MRVYGKTSYMCILLICYIKLNKYLWHLILIAGCGCVVTAASTYCGLISQGTGYKSGGGDDIKKNTGSCCCLCMNGSHTSLKIIQRSKWQILRITESMYSYECITIAPKAVVAMAMIFFLSIS